MPDDRPRRLLVCVAEPISTWIAKGEVVDRYYNPGDLFDEVHLLLTNDDDPPAEAVQRMVGRARYEVHNLPTPRLSFLWTAGWRPSLLRPWTARGVRLARAIGPDLIRCHSAGLNAVVGRAVQRALGVPMAVSVHINPDEDTRGRATTWKSWLQTHGIARAERVSLRAADVVLPVYEPIVPFLRRIGVRRIVVAYNVLNGANLVRKASYDRHHPARALCVGRQFDAKDPSHVIRALPAVPDVELTVVGDGPLHDHLHDVAVEGGVADRVTFRRSLPNDELLREMADFDLFVVHTEYWELSKALIEPLLTGLPVILNRRRGAPVPELTEDIVRYVEGTAEGYAEGIATLLADDDARRALGQRAAAHAAERWAPDRAEAAVVDVYRKLLDRQPIEFAAVGAATSAP